MAVLTVKQLVVYTLHCCLYPALIVPTYHLVVVSPSDVQDDIEYSRTFQIFLLVIRLLPAVYLPRLLMSVVGLLCFVKCYEKKVPLRAPPLLSPFICFRVVTRGDYPSLVKQNVKENVLTCLEVGLRNFLVEVVTDIPLQLANDFHVQETVVPENYVPTSGVKYKGRALQYCLEDGVNQLMDEDWIVHLDEETLLTENSVRGIINFVSDGRHPFGQGLVIYNKDPVNQFLTLMDSIRIADDLGATRGSFKLFHKPIFGWRGSFCVCKVGPEKHVSFNHGHAASVAEDHVFCLIAYKYGYTFDYVDGEMIEKSPFTFKDFVQQRRRWCEGKWQTLLHKDIPLWCKTFLVLDVLTWTCAPILLLYPFMEIAYVLPRWYWFDAMNSISLASAAYFFIYGVIKSHTLIRNKSGLSKLTFHLIVGLLCVLPFNSIIYALSFVWFVFGQKDSFHVIQKWDHKLENIRAVVKVI